MKRRKVVVVGSCILDVAIGLADQPEAGTTVRPLSTSVSFGGKGCNQALALARLGCDVTFVTALGRDLFGDAFAAFLVHELPDPRILRTAAVDTGIGVPLLIRDQAKILIVEPGAAFALSQDFIRAQLSALEGKVEMLIIQLELLHEGVEAAIEWATLRSIPIVLNAAPRSIGYEALIGDADYVVVNKEEASWLSGISVSSEIEATQACRAILSRGPSCACVTMGPDGAVLVTPDLVISSKADATTPLNSVGAGDAFTAGLAVAILEQRSWPDALNLANRCASVACSKDGSAISMPTLNEVS